MSIAARIAKDPPPPARTCLARLALALCLTCVPALALAAGPRTCAGGDFAVEAPDAALDAEICDHLAASAEKMSTCGLRQTRPVSVEVVPSLSHPIGSCLAYFDCDYDVIRITDPASYPDLLEAGNAYALLPADVLLRTLLTHELAHALTAQTAGAQRVDIVDQEFIAAALELEFLEPEWRDVLLRASPVSLPPKPGLIDKWIYGFEPRKIATNAWQYFHASDDGCSLIRGIAQGQYSFAR